MIFYSLLGIVLFFSLFLLNNRINAIGYRSSENLLSIQKKQKWKLSAIIFVATLTIVTTLRFQVGSDYDLYVYWYGRVIPTSLSETIATNPQSLLFAVLQYFLRQISDNPGLLMFVSALLILIPFAWAVQRLSRFQIKSYFLFYCLGFFFLSLNAVRQSISVSILMLAFSFQKESKKLFAILSLISYLFHSSALIALVVLMLANKIKLNKFSVFGIVLLTVPLHLIIRIPEFVALIGRLDDRYVSHLRSAPAGYGTLLNISYLLVVFLILFANVNSTEDKEHLMYVLIGISLFSLAVSSYILSRLVPYFTIYLTIIIPSILSGSKNKDYLRLGISVSTLFYFFFYGQHYDQVIPYQTWLNI